MALSELTKEEYDKILDIAFTACEANGKCKSESLEETILKLNIIGQFELADKFEKGIKYINEDKKNN